MAGFPSPAEQYVERPLDLNELLVARPAATYFVRAAGDGLLLRLREALALRESGKDSEGVPRFRADAVQTPHGAVLRPWHAGKVFLFQLIGIHAGAQ